MTYPNHFSLFHHLNNTKSNDMHKMIMNDKL